jgi:hypothetical protein
MGGMTMPRSKSDKLWIDLLAAIGLAMSFSLVFGLIHYLISVNPMLLIVALVMILLLWQLQRWWKRSRLR